MQTILGKRDDPLINLFARQIIEKISSYTDKPLLLSISLHPEKQSVEILKEILKEIENSFT